MPVQTTHFASLTCPTRAFQLKAVSCSFLDLCISSTDAAYSGRQRHSYHLDSHSTRTHRHLPSTTSRCQVRRDILLILFGLTSISLHVTAKLRNVNALMLFGTNQFHRQVLIMSCTSCANQTGGGRATSFGSRSEAKVKSSSLSTAASSSCCSVNA